MNQFSYTEGVSTSDVKQLREAVFTMISVAAHVMRTNDYDI